MDPYVAICDHAFMRLRERVNQHIGDEQLVAWASDQVRQAHAANAFTRTAPRWFGSSQRKKMRSGGRLYVRTQAAGEPVALIVVRSSAQFYTVVTVIDHTTATTPGASAGKTCDVVTAAPRAKRVRFRDQTPPAALVQEAARIRQRQLATAA